MEDNVTDEKELAYAYGLMEAAGKKTVAGKKTAGHKNRNKWLYTILVLIIALGITTGFVTLFNFPKAVNKQETKMQSYEPDDKPCDTEVSYLNETAYGNSGTLDREAFMYPFQKSGNYVMNKEYIQLIDESELLKLQVSSVKYLNTIFGSSFRSVASDEEGYVQNIKNCFAGDYLIRSGEEESVEEYASALAQWYVDNHVKSETDVLTDNSLVWKDNFCYVRNIMAITLYSCEDASYFTELTGVKLSVGETEKLICDVALVNSGTDYRIVSYQIMGNYKEG